MAIKDSYAFCAGISEPDSHSSLYFSARIGTVRGQWETDVPVPPRGFAIVQDTAAFARRAR